MQVTKIKLEQKQKEGIAEARSGQRGPVSTEHPRKERNLCLLLLTFVASIRDSWRANSSVLASVKWLAGLLPV